VDGHAIAGGAILANACDIRVCEDDGRIRLGLTELKVGVPFPPKVLAQVRHRVVSAERVVLEAGLYPPQTALRLGLVDEVVHGAERWATRKLKELDAIDAELYAETKASFRDGVTDVETGEVADRWVSIQPRIRAFLASLKR
jgi:enoyl-CoA hydratase